MKKRGAGGVKRQSDPPLPLPNIFLQLKYTFTVTYWIIKFVYPSWPAAQTCINLVQKPQFRHHTYEGHSMC